MESLSPWRYLARPVVVRFALANTPYEVLHRLAEVPDGHQQIDGDCIVTRAPGRQHTKDLAFVQSNRADSFAVLAFGMFREEPLNVQATR